MIYKLLNGFTDKTIVKYMFIREKAFALLKPDISKLSSLLIAVAVELN